MKKLLTTLTCTLLVACNSQTPREPLDKYLSEGRVKDALKAYGSGDTGPQSQFEMGLVSVIDSLYTFSTGILSHLKRTHTGDVPFALSSAPKPITYAILRSHFVDLKESLRRASTHLEKGGTGDWKTTFRPQQIKLDLNGDGKLEDSERAGELFSFGLTRSMGSTSSSADVEKFEIAADAADSLWLAGYCNLLASMLDLVLIYDWSPLYQAFGAEIFERVDDPTPSGLNVFQMSIKIQDKSLGDSARSGFLKVLELNQATMAALARETDNDREWIPSATQTSVTGLSIDAARWTAWQDFAKDFRMVLEGEAFLDMEGSRAHGMGLNVEKLFQDPPGPLNTNSSALLQNYMEAAPPEKILTEERALFRFLQGDGLSYAFFIN
jgi:hypothetical protein